MCMTPEKDRKLFKSLVDNLVQLDRVTTKEADVIYAEYKQYLEMAVIKNYEQFLNFNKRENRLDQFFFANFGGLSSFSKLSH